MKINLLELTYYTTFLETFLSIIIIYSMIICTLLKNNISNILIQNKLSDLFGFILFMSCFIIINENLQLYAYIGFNKCIITDNLSIFSKISICFFSSLFFYVISDYLKDTKLTFEFVILLFFAIIGLIFLCSTNDLLLSFLSFELVSLVSYALASFKKNSKYSIESGIKYLIIGAISTSFFLLGTSFFYFFTGSSLISDINMLFYDYYKLVLKQPKILNIDEIEKLSYYLSGQFDIVYLNFSLINLILSYIDIKMLSDHFIFYIWFYNFCFVDFWYSAKCYTKGF